MNYKRLTITSAVIFIFALLWNGLIHGVVLRDANAFLTTYGFDETAEPESDPVLVPYSKLEEDNSYYICGIALFPEYRNRGIGTQLMKLAEEQAIVKGFAKLSLIVFEQNVKAKQLYERLGYREIAREVVVPHPLIHYSGDAILMIKEV